MVKHSVNVSYSGMVTGQVFKTVLMSLFYITFKNFLELGVLV